jgi:hypothetical protein
MAENLTRGQGPCKIVVPLIMIMNLNIAINLRNKERKRETMRNT